MGVIFLTIQPLKIIADHYGKDHQLLKFAEECGELQTAIARFILNPNEKNYENLIEEMADVRTMAQQVEYLLDIEDNVDVAQAKKILRQLLRIGKLNDSLFEQ